MDELDRATRKEINEPGARLPVAALDVLGHLARAADIDEALRLADEARWRLGREVLRFEALISAMIARVEHIHALEELAATDALTRVANRRGFEEALERELARRTREGGTHAIILLDLDGLKTINDTLGHAAGDDAIRTVARACVETVRATDTVARIGGDELAVLLPRADAAAAEVVAARIRQRAERFEVGGRSIGVSYGVADTREGKDKAKSLLAAADDALYRDKRARKATRSRRRRSITAGTDSSS